MQNERVGNTGGLIPDEQLPKWLGSIARRMLTDFQASGELQHRGAKGEAREGNLLNNYLKKYLPRNVSPVNGGEVVSADGSASGQCDILIVDPSTPPLWEESGYRVVPTECLYMVIEVKSFLDPRELRSAWKKIEHIKSLPKKAYYRVSGESTLARDAYGETWTDFVPTTGMVFSYQGASLQTLGNTVVDLAEESELKNYLDSVWVLDKGSLVWLDPETERIDPCPRPNPDLGSIDSTPEQVLVALTSHLHEHLATARMPPFRIRDYLGQASWGTKGLFWENQQR